MRESLMEMPRYKTSRFNSKLISTPTRKSAEIFPNPLSPTINSLGLSPKTPSRTNWPTASNHPLTYSLTSTPSQRISLNWISVWLKSPFLLFWRRLQGLSDNQIESFSHFHRPSTVPKMKSRNLRGVWSPRYLSKSKTPSRFIGRISNNSPNSKT
jgi:hypothetical protein